MLIAVLYVDDIFIARTTTEFVALLKESLIKEFKMKEFGKAIKFTRFNIKQNEGHEFQFTLHDYMRTILRDYNIKNCRSGKTPSIVSQGLTLNDDSHILLTDVL